LLLEINTDINRTLRIKLNKITGRRVIQLFMLMERIIVGGCLCSVWARLKGRASSPLKHPSLGLDRRKDSYDQGECVCVNSRLRPVMQQPQTQEEEVGNELVNWLCCLSLCFCYSSWLRVEIAGC
jgi:hypothetical protein